MHKVDLKRAFLFISLFSQSVEIRTHTKSLPYPSSARRQRRTIIRLELLLQAQWACLKYNDSIKEVRSVSLRVTVRVNWSRAVTANQISPVHVGSGCDVMGDFIMNNSSFGHLPLLLLTPCRSIRAFTTPAAWANDKVATEGYTHRVAPYPNILLIFKPRL